LTWPRTLRGCLSGAFKVATSFLLLLSQFPQSKVSVTVASSSVFFAFGPNQGDNIDAVNGKMASSGIKWLKYF